MRAIIVDDEPNMHDVLPAILELIGAEVTIIGNAYNVASARTVITANKPDLLFLDIDMPDGTGFDLLELIDAGNYLIIFISAHSEFGRRALEFEALAYLDKPPKATDLAKALKLAAERHELRNYAERISDLTEVLANYREERLPSRLTIANSEGIHFIPIEEITYLKGATDVTTVVTKDNNKVSRAQRLKSYERQFAGYPQFMKVHQNYLVNLLEIRSLSVGNILELPDGTEVRISGQTARDLRDRLSNL